MTGKVKMNYLIVEISRWRKIMKFVKKSENVFPNKIFLDKIFYLHCFFF